MMSITIPQRLPSVFVAFVGLVVLAGCGGGGTEEASIDIIKAGRSPEIEGAATTIESIEDGAVLDDPKVSVVVTAENFETGVQTDTERADSLANSENGQHFHLILDNQPYMANYGAGESFDLGELEPGAHTLVAFPSRSYHESVKGAGAYAFPGAYKTYDFVNFYVKEKTGEPMLNTEDPAVLYSRPKGTYSGTDADRILLDFYLHNVELSSDGYKAKYTISEDGERITSRAFTKWQPAYVTNLSPGTYEVRLRLLDENGKVVPGPTNNTTREITVEE